VRSRSLTKRPGYWDTSASIDRPGNRQVVMPVDDLLLAGAAAAFPKQLD
jgi:hypothetical protein